MALIHSNDEDGGQVAQVNTKGGLATVVRKRGVIGAFVGTMYTGTIPASFAANSVIAGIRNGLLSDRRVYISRMRLSYYTITAATAAAAVSISCTRYSVANLQQVGTHATTCGLLDCTTEDVPWGFSTGINTIPLSACAIGGPHGGQMTVMTTTALTTTGVTVDTLEAPILFMNCTTTTPAILDRVEALHAENELGLEHPIELGPGEGLLFRNPVATPTGLTGVLLIRIHWQEY